jgi:hypothetical protein
MSACYAARPRGALSFTGPQVFTAPRSRRRRDWSYLRVEGNRQDQPSRRTPAGQREPRRWGGAIWAAITRQRIVSPRRNSPSRGVAPTTTPNQRPRISQPHRGTAATGPAEPRCQPRQPDGVVLPRGVARQSGPRPGSGRSPPQLGHIRRSMTTATARRRPYGGWPWKQQPCALRSPRRGPRSVLSPPGLEAAAHPGGVSGLRYRRRAEPAPGHIHYHQ